MRDSHLQFHLFARRVGDDGLARWVNEPLVVQVGQVLRLNEDAHASDEPSACVAMESVPDAVTPRILVATLGGYRVLLNGSHAPPIAVAGAGDEIGLDGRDEQWRLHVSIYRTAAIGPAGDELIGRECPLCLGHFSSGKRVFRCACGSVLHVADAAGTGGELDCARAVTHCPDCRRAIVLESGYEELPRDDSGREILPSHRSEHAAAAGASVGG